MKIVFFSGSDFTIPILESILASENKSLHSIAKDQFENLQLVNQKQFYGKIKDLLEATQDLVFAKSKVSLKTIITTPDYTLRGKTIQNKLTKFASHNSIELFQPEKIKLEWEAWKSTHLTGGEIAAVASFGKILNDNVLNSFEYGALNWHPSKLPQYRGMSPMQFTLLNGEQKTALSWIEMTQEMDGGNLLLQLDKQLLGHETLSDLTTQMVELGAKSWAIAMLSEAYSKINADKQFQVIQDVNNVSLTSKITKELGLIDYKCVDANKLFNHYRAYYGWPKTIISSQTFAQKISLIECFGVVSEISPDIVIYEDGEWVQTLENKKLLTYLKAGLGGFIQVLKIKLETGKEINFQGYKFK